MRQRRCDMLLPLLHAPMQCVLKKPHSSFFFVRDPQAKQEAEKMCNLRRQKMSMYARSILKLSTLSSDVQVVMLRHRRNREALNQCHSSDIVSISPTQKSNQYISRLWSLKQGRKVDRCDFSTCYTQVKTEYSINRKICGCSQTSNKVNLVAVWALPNFVLPIPGGNAELG